MLLKEQFYTTCNSLGLEDHELDLAFSVWERAERAMSGAKEKKVPRLLEKDSQKPQTLVQSGKFSQAELQRISRLMKNFITQVNKAIEAEREYSSQMYVLCDPEDRETALNFRELNSARNNLRKLRQWNIEYSNLQKKIKDTLKSTHG
jgi:hypothetical protein